MTNFDIFSFKSHPDFQWGVNMNNMNPKHQKLHQKSWIFFLRQRLMVKGRFSLCGGIFQSLMSNADPNFVWAAHKNFAVLVPKWFYENVLSFLRKWFKFVALRVWQDAFCQAHVQLTRNRLNCLTAANSNSSRHLVYGVLVRMIKIKTWLVEAETQYWPLIGPWHRH